MLVGVLNALYDSINSLLKYVDLFKILCLMSLVFFTQLITPLLLMLLAYFITRRNVEKRSLLDHMEAVFLIIDELIDGG